MRKASGSAILVCAANDDESFQLPPQGQLRIHLLSHDLLAIDLGGACNNVAQPHLLKSRTILAIVYTKLEFN